MASSGSFNTSGYQGRYLTFNWSVASQSIANNQTTINWNLKGAGGSTSSWFMSGNFAVVIDGATVYASATRIKLYNGTTVASGSYTFNHNADGNRSFSASAQAGIYTVAVNCSGSGSWALPQIPRKATLTNAPNFNDTQNPTINYSNPAGNSVSSLQAYIENANNNQVLVGLRDIPKTGSSYTFPLTEAERNALRQATPNSNTLTVRFCIRTIIGGNTDWSTLNKTLTIVNASPSIGSTDYFDSDETITNITGNDQIIVQNVSTLKFNLYDINAVKYATLSRLSITINGSTKAYSLSGYGVSSLTVQYGAVDVSSNTNATIVVTDSRGNTATYTKALTIESYSLPSAIITCQRENNYYSETNINVNADYSSLNGKNVIDIKYQYKKTTDTTYSEVENLQDNVTTTFTIDNDYAWDVKVILTDLLGTTTYNLFVDKGIPITFFDRLNNSVGVNCFPLNQKSLEVNGISITPIVLYDNSSGSTGNITLSDSAANYSTLEIFYKKETQSSVKVLNPDGQSAVLTLHYYYTNVSTYQIVQKCISISGESITVNTSQSYYANFKNNSYPSIGIENQIKIIKVIGYK